MTSVEVNAPITAAVGGSFGKVEPMSPIVQSVPSTPPSDHEVCNKSVSESSEEVFETSGGLSVTEKISYQPVCSPPSEPDGAFRTWSTSPAKKPTTSPSVSPTPSRISSHGSSETPDHVSSKPCATEPVTPLPFPDSRLSPEGFKMSPSFVSEHMNPYLRLHPNPFQMAHGFLSHPFLSTTNFGLISQQLHPSAMGKIHSQDLLSMQKDIPSMTMQQLQFLQNRLQCLPSSGLPCSPVPPSKPIFPDSKAQLSLLIQARKNPKPGESERSFRPLNSKQPYQSPDCGKGKNPRRSSMEESDSDELLSVGSESPPLPYATPSRRDTDNESDAGSSSLDCASSIYSKSPFQTSNARNSKMFPGNPLGKTQSKTVTANNRTLKFSIDNILKSDFGSETVPCVKKPSKVESKKVEKEVERTPSSPKEPKKGEAEKEAPTPMDLTNESSGTSTTSETPMLWPAWVYCTRYSDRPSSGPRTRRPKNKDKNPEEKRPRTAFSGDQLSRLKHEFAENRYLTERRRQDLARELGLNEAQIKIWFQNKRAKMKKARGEKNPLALQLMAQGLYNHSTVPLTREEEEAAAAELSD